MTTTKKKYKKVFYKNMEKCPIDFPFWVIFFECRKLLQNKNNNDRNDIAVDRDRK